MEGGRTMFMSDFFVARRGGFGNRHSLVRVGLALCLVVLACFGGAPHRSYAASAGPNALIPVLVKDINPLTTPSSPDLLTPVGNALYFVADDGVYGRELWETDGTLTSTKIITDIRPNHSSDPQALRVMSDTLLFAAISPSVDVSLTHSFDFCDPHQLFRTDGTLTNTIQLTNFPKGMGTFVDLFTMGCYYEAESSAVLGGYSFFSAGGELWKTDGTVSGTMQVTTLTLPPATLLRLTNFVVISNTIFFQLGQAIAQMGAGFPKPRQLWASDGTASGTRLVKEFTFDILENSVMFNNKLLVLANSPEAGSSYGLWSSDGTTTGTIGLKALARPEQLTVVGDHAFVADTESEAFTALWRTDGTVTGTTKVAGLPLLVGRNWWLKSVGGRLYLRIKTPQLNGFIWDLWRLNNSENGFDLLWRGEDTGLSLPGLWQDMPVFVNSAGVWVIDGLQTRPIANLAVDPTFASNADLSNAIVGRDLFLSASDAEHGTELWRLSASAAPDIYIDSLATAPARPASRAIVQVRYGNQGSTAATTVTLTATLDISLTYVSNSLNLTPTINGNQLVWQLPGVNFLEEKPFDLIVKTPDAVLGTRYPVTMTVSSGTAEENPNNNVAQSVVVISALTYLPMVMR